DRPFSSVEVSVADRTKTIVVRFSAEAEANSTSLRIGASFIGYEQAMLNQRRELPDWDFEEAKQRGREAWQRELGRVEIEGATAEQKSTFYTALYRVLQFPRLIHEIDESDAMRHYSPFDNGHIYDGPLYTDNGLWDTYRTAFPLFVLFYPEHSRSILEGWLNAYREGGRLPNWPSPGNRPCMIGSHSDSIFADAWAKGMRSFDPREAYAAMRKNAFENDAAGWAGRDHLDEYMSLGYVPVDARRDAAASCTLEYAYGDYCVSRLAKAAGRDDDFDTLMKRAQNYRHAWDPATGFMRGRLADGTWQEPFDPLAWGGAYTEGNAWQWLWSVQQDPYGLMELLGGRDAMAQKLDELLTMPSTTVVGGYGHVIHEMREVEHAAMGQYAHVNEPNHHVLFLYNYVGQPWKTQAAVRRVLAELYDVDGMVGDEDTGQMSAWYAFNAAGFYPFCPGSPYYLIGSPLFNELTIHLEGGGRFVVHAENQGRDNVYIQSATLNGEPFTRTWLRHEEIVAGGELKFVMGPSPNRKWGVGEGDAPPNDFR
ncbi:MAG: glycoside hydrolase family 92 protein, partial [Planctomycetales bacterium]|nr:glycoside hydrolase family 92 protein [Planctomycetales bacterium]